MFLRLGKPAPQISNETKLSHAYSTLGVYGFRQQILIRYENHSPTHLGRFGCPVYRLGWYLHIHHTHWFALWISCRSCSVPHETHTTDLPQIFTRLTTGRLFTQGGFLAGASLWRGSLLSTYCASWIDQAAVWFDLHTVWRSVSAGLLKSGSAGPMKGEITTSSCVLFLFLLALSIPHSSMFVKL